MTSIPTTQNTPATPYDAKTAAIEVARLLSDDRCTDVTLLDVRGISSVQDFVVLASGTSDRQMRSAASDIKNLLPKLGSSVYRTSIDDQSTWIVVDCVDTVVHIFEPNTRSYYDLESMWGDAPKIEWLRPGQKPFTVGDEMDEPEPAAAHDEEGDTDEPTPAMTESSEPDADADIELTTGTAEAFVEEARASVAPKAKSKPKAAPAAKAKTKPAPKAKAVKKVAKKAPAKKAASKKPAPAAKKATKKPAKKVAPPSAKKPAAKKTAKKAAKKR
ncbi:MAG: ribosome silencing factor [Phycisphaerales bacterium]